jgi:catalase
VYPPYQRDGAGTLNGNYGGDPDDVRSGFRKIGFRPHSAVQGHECWHGKLKSYATVVTKKDFEQSRELWHIICNEEGGQKQFLDNIIPTLVAVVPELCEKAISE